jgi:hypothetical protein
MGAEQEQRCGRCKRTFPWESFSASHRGKTGTWCRTCVAANARGELPPAAQHEPQVCVACGKSYIPKHLKAKAAFCSPACKQDERKASGRQRELYLQRNYGIGAADYDRILAEQGGGCALCGVKPEDLTAGRYRTYLHVDHCHDTGRVRGLLCPDHNLLLGRFGDDATMFRRVVEYLTATA